MAGRRPNRRPEPANDTTLYTWVLAALLALMAPFVVLWAAARLTGDRSRDPFEWVLRSINGEAIWTTATTVVASLLGLVLVAVAAAGILLYRRWSRMRSRIDDVAAAMSDQSDITPLAEKASTAAAARLGVQPTSGPGVPLGAAVRTGQPLWGSWEWCQLWIMGPRAGKTSCVCVPQIIECRGPVVATSNKRDVVDLTRGPRSELGPVWVSDPQGLIGEPASWWWNPLSYVTSVERADELAGLFAAANREAGDRADAYFDPTAKTLLSNLLLAAAVGGQPISILYEWLADPERARENPATDPETLLHTAGHTMPATSLAGLASLHPKQRDGVYGTAVTMVQFLRQAALLPWITPDPARPEFSPDEFVRGRGTIYLLSKEGAGSARAITAAMTVAITRAAEQYATSQPRGRLSVPLLCALDEAANICRWPELPNLYSHYGSRGIILVTFLQSWSQGAEVWAAEGMKKLWSASNVRGIGRGLAEEGFLAELSKLIGDRDVISRDIQASRHGRSTSTRNRREAILEVADLAALPEGRAVLFVSGLRPILLKLVHWSRRPYGADVAASEEYYGSEVTTNV